MCLFSFARPPARPRAHCASPWPRPPVPSVRPVSRPCAPVVPVCSWAFPEAPVPLESLMRLLICSAYSVTYSLQVCVTERLTPHSCLKAVPKARLLFCSLWSCSSRCVYSICVTRRDARGGHTRGVLGLIRHIRSIRVEPSQNTTCFAHPL